MVPGPPPGKMGMVVLREIVMIHDLRRQGLSTSAIACRTGLDRKTVRKYLEQGLQSAHYGPREPRPRLLDPYEDYLRKRIAEHEGLSGRRLWRDIADLGYAGGYTAVTDFLREVRPPPQAGFERRFETPPALRLQRRDHIPVGQVFQHELQPPQLRQPFDIVPGKKHTAVRRHGVSLRGAAVVVRQRSFCPMATPIPRFRAPAPTPREPAFAPGVKIPDPAPRRPAIAEKPAFFGLKKNDPLRTPPWSAALRTAQVPLVDLCPSSASEVCCASFGARDASWWGRWRVAA